LFGFSCARGDGDFPSSVAPAWQLGRFSERADLLTFKSSVAASLQSPGGCVGFVPKIIAEHEASIADRTLEQAR
jgi:hypothetical protein